MDFKIFQEAFDEEKKAFVNQVSKKLILWSALKDRLSYYEYAEGLWITKEEWQAMKEYASSKTQSVFDDEPLNPLPLPNIKPISFNIIMENING